MGVIGTLAVNIVANTAGTQAGCALARREFASLSGQAPSVLSGLTGISTGFLGVAGGATAAALTIGKMVSATRQFVSAMASSTAIMGNVSNELRAQLEQTAKRVSFETKFSATEAGKAYYYLASAGLDAKQSMASLPVVASFAQAGLFDLEKATELLTQSQSAMGLKVNDAAQNMKNMTRIADVLTKANILAQGSVEDFATALSHKAAGALRVVNKDVEEGVAVLAALADQGIKAEEAGTALNIVLREFQTRSIKNPDAFKQLGIDVYRANGQMHNMADIIGQLERALKPLAAKDRKIALMDLGFQDKSVAFIQMLLGTSERIRQYETELRSASGVTDEVAMKNIPTFERALKRLHAAFDNLATNVGAPALEAFGNSVIFVTDALTTMDSPMTAGVVKLAAFSAGFLAAAVIIPKVIGVVSLLIKSLRGLAAAEAIATALTGPKGWLVLAGSLAAGYLAVQAVESAFSGLEQQAQSAADSADGTAEAAKTAMNAIADEAEEVGESIERTSKKAQKEADKAAKKLEDEGKRVAESVRTPAETMAATVEHLNSLVADGAITWETYRRAVMKANKEMTDAQEHEIGRGHHDNAAVTRGSTAAFNAVQASRQEMARIARVAEQQLQAQKDANNFLKTIADNSKKDPVTIKKASI